jgi:hypothetical protein
MNREQKLEAILERLGKKGIDIDGGHISAMVITGYLDDLSKLGLIESAYDLTPSGAAIRAVCDEFGWEPDNDEIKAFVMEQVAPQEQAPFAFMLKKWRDDREGLKEDFLKAKQSGEIPPTFGG